MDIACVQLKLTSNGRQLGVLAQRENGAVSAFPDGSLSTTMT